MTLKNNRAPLVSNIKLYASFHHNMWIQTGVTVRKRLSLVMTSVTLTFDLWPWPFAWTSLPSLVITPENFVMWQWREHSQKGATDRQTDGQTENTIHRAAWLHLFYVTSSFMHHFLAISQLKLELQSGNTISGQNWQFLIPCDLAIWQMTLQNNRAPLLCYFKICASFHNHWLIPTQVTVQKRPIWVKISDFWSRVTSKFDGWPWKTIGHLFNATSSFVHHFTTIGEFKLELQSGNAQFGSKSSIFLPVWPWYLMDDLQKQ